MGRKKKKIDEKAIKISVTVRPETDHDLQVRVGQGRKKSRIINDDLTWYREIMNTVGLSMQGRFAIQEIEALQSVVNKITIEPGQIALLRKNLVSIFSNKNTKKTACLSQGEIKDIERKFKISSQEICKKLTAMDYYENIWLYEKLVFTRSKGITDRKDLMFVFRCKGEDG